MAKARDDDMKGKMSHADEIRTGERFSFGENWARFLSVLDDDRIKLAEQSLRQMLAVENLVGKSFLDIGSGSGLFSLAAHRLGARVHSFDFDPQSVACTLELKGRYAPSDPNWVVEQGSVLEKDYLRTLGKWDVVYSWGVLHHTGAMYQALENVVALTKEDGKLFIAIYNDQGLPSRYWSFVKSTFNKSAMARILLIMIHAPYLFGMRWLIRALSGQSHLQRGMSLWHDMIDWLGGYPFEVAKPEAMFRFFRSRGFVLKELKTCGGRMGCNEFVFERHAQKNAENR
jgi:2-polyprenyl-3-methyl-5-hydroxy-6-metoxy-1,4-benzoquinol methylase